MGLTEIKAAIVQLTVEELAELMAWVQEYREQVSDKRIVAQQQPSLDDVYAILGERYASGEHDVAARHNEHQP